MSPFNTINNLRQNRGKNITRENISAVDHAERPKRPPSKSLDTYSYRSLVAFKQSAFGTERVYRKAKLTGHIKMTWQDSERWLSGQNALWIAVFDRTYMQTWQMFNSLKESGGKKPFSGRHCGDDMSTQDCSIICLSNHNNTTCFPLRVNCNVEEQAKASNSIFARACWHGAFLLR